MLFYQPGLLYGGTIEHECNTQRAIGFYLEALLMLAPFMKNPLRATLKGVTNDPVDPSVSMRSHRGGAVGGSVVERWVKGGRELMTRVCVSLSVSLSL